jgi:hypothetical protein
MDGEIMTICYCPKCERYHKIRIRWIGRGIPRIYCRCCKGQCELSEDIYYPNPMEAFREQEGAC